MDVRRRSWVPKAVSASAFVLCAYAAGAGVGAPASSPPARDDAGTPSMGPGGKSVLGDTVFEDVLARVQSGKSVPRSTALVRGAFVRIEVLGSSTLRRAVKDAGGTVVASTSGLVLADVPAGKVEALAGAPGVRQVRLPLDYSVVPPSNDAPQSLQRARDGVDAVATQATGGTGGEVLVKTGIDAWHAAGFTGTGMKIGIIDSFKGAAWNAAAASGDVPVAPAGAFCLANNVNCGATFWNGGAHGVAVSEIVRDMAPGAELYLATVSTITDYQAAIDYFASQGVRIITRSLGAPYDGPGNGVGELDNKVVDYAIAKGLTWFNSAGNSAGTASRLGAYYRTAWTDTDGDGWLNFADGSNYQGFFCNPDGSLFYGVRWSDWGAGKTDYDLYVYDTTADAAPYAKFELDQVAGQLPIEGAGFRPSSCGTNDYDYFAVHLDPRTAGTTQGDVLEMMTNGSKYINWNNPYSATQPASDSANPGAASVGAVDPLSGTLIAPYSSWGPTNDGRMKPDMSAASNISSVSYPSGFNGTSAATPVLAGAAAVVLAREPGLTPTQLIARMKSYVVERGVAGPDNVYGTGELLMPALPAPPAVVAPAPAPTPEPVPAAPPVAAGAPGITSVSFRPVMKKLSKELAVDVRWGIATAQASAVVARSVNRGQFLPVAAVAGGRTSAHAQLLLGKVNQLAVSYADAVGTVSPFAFLPQVVPTIFDDRHRKVATGRGWQRVVSPKAWDRTLSATNTGARARLPFRGLAVSLVMTKSANSGAMRVLVDGRSVGRVNLHSRQVEPRRVVMNLYANSKGHHVVEIQPLTRGPQGWIFLDAFVVLS